MEKNSVISLPIKLFKGAVLIKLAVSCAVFAMAVYTLKPKFDKIEGIDTEKLIKDHSYDLSEAEFSLPEKPQAKNSQE